MRGKRSISGSIGVAFAFARRSQIQLGLADAERDGSDEYSPR